MLNKKIFILAIQYLSHRRLRSWLTIIGVIIGISLVATIILLSSGLENAILGFLQSLGSDIVMIMPGEEGAFQQVLLGKKLRDKDVDAIRKVEGVEMAVPAVLEAGEEITYRGEIKKTYLIAQPVREAKEIFEVSQGFKMKEGEWPVSESAREIFTGFRFAKKIYKEDMLVGDTVIIKNKTFVVKGILAEIGDPDVDTAVFMSLEQFRRTTGIRDNILRVVAKISPGYDPKQVAEEIKLELKQVPGVPDFSVMTSEKMQELIADIIGVLRLVLTGIAIFTLIVGGIGIMNTMYTSVVERTKHIGIMKSVGATARQISMLFVFEAGLIGLVGGIIGTVIGVGLAKAVELIAKQMGFGMLAVEVQVLWLLGVFLFAFFVGVLSGFFPARQAASLKPADALRYE